MFPYELNSLGSTARCMLENDSKKIFVYEDSTEDVIVKIVDNAYDKEVH